MIYCNDIKTGVKTWCWYRFLEAAFIIDILAIIYLLHQVRATICMIVSVALLCIFIVLALGFIRARIMDVVAEIGYQRHRIDMIDEDQ